MMGPDKPASVQVKFADGSEHALPIHGIRQLQIMGILDELGVKNWSEVTGTPATLQAIRFMEKVVATALSFPKQPRTVAWIQESFADAEQIANAFTACLELSNLPQAPHSIKPVTAGQKPGAYS